MPSRGILVAMAAAVLAGVGGCSPPPLSSYTSAAGGYSVRIPGTPKLQDQSVTTDMGPIVAHLAVADVGSRGAYFVSYADFPGGLQQGGVENRLDMACDGMMPPVNGQIRERKPVRLGNHPGREIKFGARPKGVAGDVTGIARVFAVGNRLYQVMMLAPASTFNAATSTAFLDSFRLADGSASPTAVPVVAPTQAAPVSAPVQAPAAVAAPAPGDWGTVEDPDRDCQVKVEGPVATMVVPGTIHDMSMPPGRTNGPKIMRPVQGDFFAEVRIGSDVRAAEPPSPGSAVAFNGAGLLLWGDDGDFLRLESASISRGGSASPYILFEHHRTGMPTENHEVPYPGGPVWLRLQRTGNQIAAWYNIDNQNWVPLRPMDFTAPGPTIGVAAVNTSSMPFSVRFESLRVGKP